jgi:hypothetical protein
MAGNTLDQMANLASIISFRMAERSMEDLIKPPIGVFITRNDSRESLDVLMLLSWLAGTAPG